MTLSKLSLRNAKRQASDYMVYFVTIVLSCAMFYAFNALVFSKELFELSTELEYLPAIITLSSIVVVFIIGWLVSYISGFMLSRRGRELGTYLLIGVENRQIARLFCLENLEVGGVALILGIPLGNLIFQALRAILFTMFSAPYHFGFTFSIKAIGLTLLYFALVYFVALRKSRKRIRKMKIYDLIYSERKNEAEIVKKSGSRKIIFSISIVLGILGTFLLISATELMPGILGAGCLIVFMYGFFFSFSSGVPAFFDRKSERKFRGQNLLIFRALTSKLATMGMLMATIAVLFTATLLTEGAGMAFNSAIQEQLEKNSFDLLFTTENKSHIAIGLEYIEKHIPLLSSLQYKLYQSRDSQFSDYLTGKTSYYNHCNDMIMSYSDYTALRAMLNYPSVKLEPGSYLIHCLPYLENTLTNWNHPVSVGNQILSLGGVNTEQFAQKLWDGNGNQFLLIIPDELCTDDMVYRFAFAALTSEPVYLEMYVSLCNAIGGAMDGMRIMVYGKDLVYSKAVSMANGSSLSAIIVFPLFYLALTLAMTAATILTIQQLSEAQRYHHQFELLRKLGMDGQEAKKTLFRQFAIYYAMPVIPPIFIAAPFIKNLAKTVGPGAVENPPMILAASLGLFFLIYLIYIVIAYTSMKQNVLPE